MVVRSVVRRGRLKDLGVSKATFRAAGEPLPVGAPVEIPSDKKIKVTVTIENTGSRSITNIFWFYAFYAETLSDESGDPSEDYSTWYGESDDFDNAVISETTLNPGDTLTMEGLYPVSADHWAEGTLVDAGIVIGMGSGDNAVFLDSLKITDAVKIVAPALKVEITDVTFSETE